MIEVGMDEMSLFFMKKNFIKCELGKSFYAVLTVVGSISWISIGYVRQRKLRMFMLEEFECDALK